MIVDSAVLVAVLSTHLHQQEKNGFFSLISSDKFNIDYKKVETKISSLNLSLSPDLPFFTQFSNTRPETKKGTQQCREF